jgi:hypothetical protein
MSSTLMEYRQNEKETTKNTTKANLTQNEKVLILFSKAKATGWLGHPYKNFSMIGYSI